MKSHDVLIDQDPDCEAYMALRRQRFPHRYAAAILGWQPDHAECIRKRAERRRSRNTTLPHQGFGRTQTGALFSINFAPSSEIQFSGPKIGLELMTTDFQNELNQAQDRHADLVNQSRSAAASVAEMEVRLSQLHLAAEADDADAVLTGRAQANWPKQIGAAESELKAARRTAKSIADATTRQALLCERILGQIDARRFEIFSKAIAAPQKRLDAAVLGLMSAASDVQDIAVAHAFYEHPLVSRDDLNFEMQASLVGLVRAALQAVSYWRIYYDNCPIPHKPENSIPFLIAPAARKRDPLEVQVGDQRALLCELNDKYRLAYYDLNLAEREIDLIKHSLLRIGGVVAAASAAQQKELSRLRQVAEDKAAEVKRIAAARAKAIELISALEKQLATKLSAAVAA